MVCDCFTCIVSALGSISLLFLWHTRHPLERVRHSMAYCVLSVGSRVRVTSYGPFREQWGTIREVHAIAADLEEPFCYYLVALDSRQKKEPLWFDFSEVELITSSLVSLEI
jgi:hypothetical protein